MGSGLNNLRKFMAHSRIGVEGVVTNPFQRAFGFTCQDVWGLINHYVDNIWHHRGDHTDSTRDAFKHKLFNGFLHHFDGYRIGSEGCIFSPFAIMSFIKTLNLATPASVTFEGFRFWSESGRLGVLDSTTVSDTARLEGYFNYLSVSFLRKREARRHTIAAMERQQREQQEQLELSPPEYDEVTGRGLASVCMVRASELADDLEAGQILHASSVMVLLYQAGYLAPVAKDKVAIPNTEVHDDLQRLFNRLAVRNSLGTRMSGLCIAQMGICNEQMETFARYLHTSFAGVSQLQEEIPEAIYQNYICFILAPVRTVSFMLRQESAAGNGRADVLMLPIAGPEDGLQPPSFCVIFELKSYDGDTIGNNGTRMGIRNRRRLAAHLWGQTRGAETQIYDRYFANIAATAGWCRTIYVVAMTLWTNRFCMIVAKRTRPAHDGGAGRWPVRRLPDDNRSADIDMEQADLSAVQYASLDDQFGNPNSPAVRMHYSCGRLIAISV